MTDWLLTDDLAPDSNGGLAPLYASAARGVLCLPFCAACDTPLDLEQAVCDRCGSVLARWREVEPRGTVHTATLVHRREPGLVLAEGAYPAVDVELADGHRLVMTSVEPADSAPAIGTEVTVGFRVLSGVAVPAYRLAAADQEGTP